MSGMGDVGAGLNVGQRPREREYEPKYEPKRLDLNCCGGSSERDEEGSGRREAWRDERRDGGSSCAKIFAVAVNLAALGSIGTGLWLKFTGQGEPSPDSTTASYSSTTVPTRTSPTVTGGVGIDDILIGVGSGVFALEILVCCISCLCKKKGDKSRPSTASTGVSTERQELQVQEVLH